MAVFKKLKKSKDKNAIPEPEPIKQLDSRFGMDSYRDFFTLKNYWKSVDRKKVESANFLFYRLYTHSYDNFINFTDFSNPLEALVFLLIVKDS